ncbi:prolyl-tRNA synthetase [Lepidopterella palustris CBS 459.81]|uniref:proline--tRNA ligase n=1 Tax=Lepidopterella palustris CBS 459.81 TaxID=1314670 RepID=A0A8E2E895_9PEZI|nr:prolyl-tRNA synthetase [Lepidopterella palustris CBS 459.81]
MSLNSFRASQSSLWTIETIRFSSIPICCDALLVVCIYNVLALPSFQMSNRPVHGLLSKSLSGPKTHIKRYINSPCFRSLHVDGRNRLSTFWAPTGGISPTAEEDGSHVLLIRGGFLRQAHSGVFHLLPLGLRVQDKLERAIDKHMRSIGASKLSLSSISSEELWKQTGRYSENSELLRLKDRRDSGFLLSPTHEEEITTLVAGIVNSYKDLPLRIYQISRKYRDERRPRQGLLRAKEFLMKDLYTFDYTPEMALETYDSVRNAYSEFFNELKIPYLVADADSGTMGGNLSHEYHYISPKGEDHVCSCDKCSYVANEELAQKGQRAPTNFTKDITIWLGVSKDKSTLVLVYLPKQLPSSQDDEKDASSNSHVNIHAVKEVYPDLDTSIESGTLAQFPEKRFQYVRIFDHRVSPDVEDPVYLNARDITTHPISGKPLDLTRIQTGDPCPRCEDGTLHVQRCVEVGHTFHLGMRYSEPLNAVVTLPAQSSSKPATASGQVTMQMGCHGIGVSRLVGTVAALLCDSRGLNWPRAIAPFECVIVPTRGVEEDALEVYDTLRGTVRSDVDIDAILDDRPIKELAWKLRDADLIGYPVILVLGRAWKKERKVEVQCRRLGVKEDVELGSLREVVQGILDKL